MLEALARLTAGPLRDGDDVHEAVLEPGLDAAAIDTIAARVGAPLPADLRSLLGATRGIEGLELTIDLTGGAGFELEDLFPHGHSIATDYAGNAWVVDCLTEPEPEAAVFFACHDPPVILWQCRGMATFLHQLRRSSDKAPHEDVPLIDDVFGDRRRDVWRTNADTVDWRAALEARDAELRAFAGTLGQEWTVTDLRTPSSGMGFSWGRYGSRTRLRRHGEARIFACAPPERGSGLLSRLFGR